MGGEAGSRGYIFQAIVAIIECLERDDWTAIKMEPETDNDKVDIKLFNGSVTLSAIQVKSRSTKAFGPKEVEGWLDDLKKDAPGAKKFLLYLVGDNLTKECEEFVRKHKKEIEVVPFKFLQDACTGKLARYVKDAGLGEMVTVKGLGLIDASLFTEIFKNSIAKDPVSHSDFASAFQLAIPVQKVDNSLPPIPKCLTLIPAVNQSVGLIGRDDIVKNVRGLLEKNNGTALVNGLGGIGKTAVMLYICNKLKDEGNYVAWFKWESSLKDGLLLLRDTLRIPATEKADKAYEFVISTIRTQLAGKLYLFIDDLTRRLSDDEMSLLNSLQIHVMVTSRFEYEYFKNVSLDVLEKDAAIDMFFEYYARKRNSKDEVTAWNIIDFVHSHTLLVELLAKAAREEGGTLNKLYDTLQDKGFFEVSDEEVRAEHDKEYLTIEQSIIKLYAISNLSEAEQHIMKLFTIFTPEKPIYAKFREWADLDRDTMKRLIDLGWLDKEGGYIIHQIVKDSLSKQTGEVRLEDYGNLLYNLIDTKNYLSVMETYEVIRERILLTADIARYLWDEYQADRERDEWWASNAGGLINNLASVYAEQDDYEKALEYYGKALAIHERVLGTEHPDTASTYNNMANMYCTQGAYNKALRYYRKTVAIRERVLGTEHPDTARTYGNMSNLYAEQGDYDKALEYFEKVQAIFEQVLGTEHPDTAKMYNNIAIVYKNQGDYDKALEYYQRALKVYLTTFGEEHPRTKGTRKNLTDLQEKMNQ